MGLTNTPAGEATSTFPIVNFAGTDAPSNSGGSNENTATALHCTFLHNVRWNVGRHSLTFRGQIAWLL